MDDSTRDLTPESANVELAKYLWEEYRYRHDLIWKLMFRMSAAAVLLSIAPFTIDDLAKEKAGEWVDALPAIALALVAISWLVLLFELRLFNPINDAYVRAQRQAVDEVLSGDRLVLRPRGPDVFAWVVRLYPVVLFVLLLVVALVAWSTG